MAAAIVELDTLPDAIWPAAQDHHFFLVRGSGLIRRLACERRLVGRIHIRGGRGELGSAGVDALEDRPHAERVAFLRYRFGSGRCELSEAGVGKSHGLEPAERAGRSWQTLFADLRLGIDEFTHLAYEPRVDPARGVDFLVGEAKPHGLRYFEDAVGRGRAE